MSEMFESAVVSRGRLRETRMQDAPEAAKRFAMARPMPREAPVMRAVLLARGRCILVSSLGKEKEKVGKRRLDVTWAEVCP